MNAIEISKKMETDAIRFYTEAGKKMRHPAGKKMFETVTEDEKRHLEIVNNILNGLDMQVKDFHQIKSVRTVFESLKDVMMSKVRAATDELEAFKIAMHMEKEGVEFYRKLMSKSKTKKEKTLFARLIMEEEQHYEVFANTYDFLQDTGNWFMWEEHSMVDGGTPWA
ncbi:MAG: ferritin family protein [Nitrospirae bacterium]|nr:ferritin family protein [Nitrospirota bacterium]